MMANDSTGACHEWIRCWKSIQSLMKKYSVSSIEEFDTRFLCTQMLFNWVQDFEMELGNAALADRSLNRVRKEFCEDILPLLNPSDENTWSNMTRAIAESLFNMGDRKAAFSLYRSRLEENPRWGWGWVGWADLYSFCDKTEDRFRQAEKILLQGLSVPGVSEAAIIRERLGDVREVMAHHSAPAPAEAGKPAQGSKRKVGRNLVRAEAD
jgi:tetratricopeptide (TPR) repeat protein